MQNIIIIFFFQYIIKEYKMSIIKIKKYTFVFN